MEASSFLLIYNCFMPGSSGTDLNTPKRTASLQSIHKELVSDEVHFCLISAYSGIQTKKKRFKNTTPIIILFPSDQPIHIDGKFLTLSLSEDDLLSLLLNPLYLKAPGKSIELSPSGRCKEQFYEIHNDDSLKKLRSLFQRLTLDTSTVSGLLDKEMFLLSLLIQLKSLPSLNEIDLSKSIDEKNEIWSIEDLIEHIRIQFDNPLSLDEMASRCALNASYLSRSFKIKTGTTIFAYLNRVRIEKACLLLRNSSLTITEIAFSVGYNNISFFNRMFKRAMSVTPGEYRRKVRI
ncbi:MAG: AraC family transcriptional regulator [Spirochaetales bacterium]|nr:AraC family transcriptional regulator [Spirochaetales bacterium]